MKRVLFKCGFYEEVHYGDIRTSRSGKVVTVDNKFHTLVFERLSGGIKEIWTSKMNDGHEEKIYPNASMEVL